MEFKDLNLLDIGNSMEITGIVYDNGTDGVIIFLPGTIGTVELDKMYPSLEEWQQIIRQSDLKEVELVAGDKNKKIILRKSTRNIETSIMWNVFRRDNFTCRYCGADNVPMTVDHIVLWEEMGPSIERNLICSCKKCNNTRNNMQYEDWLKSPYYLSNAIKLPVEVLAANARILDDIPNIRANYLRIHKRNR